MLGFAYGAAVRLVYGFDQRVALIDERYALLREIRYFERKYYVEHIHIALELAVAAFAGCPGLGCYVIEHLQPLGMGEAGDTHIEARVVDENHGIRLPGEQVALAAAQIAQQPPRLFEHFARPHHSTFLVMVHQGAAYSCHFFSTPEAEFRLRVFGCKAAHKIGCVEVSGGLAGNQIVLHKLKPMFCKRLNSSKSVLLIA